MIDDYHILMIDDYHNVHVKKVPTELITSTCCTAVDMASCLLVIHPTIGPLHDTVTWYGINYAGVQVTQWDF